MAKSSEISITDHLLQDYQRDLPLVPEPFTHIATKLGATERDVRAACEALLASGVISRVGGVVRPNSIAASTLAAVSVPEFSTDCVGEMIANLDGVNHVYLRENPINIWFVATGPNRDFVDATLKKVELLSGQPVLDLRLEQPFHIDLGFPLKGGPKTRNRTVASDIAYLSEPSDRDLVQYLTSGLPIHTRPFRVVGEQLGLSEDTVIARLRHLQDSGIITRIGLIIRHRALGWRSNAMAVWDVAPDSIAEKGRILSTHNGINLCYQRRRYDGIWPYNLYCMIHAKSRETALQILDDASRLAGLENTPRQILFSSRCYKQTGALIISRAAA